MSFANTFKALADPIRRDILVMLKNGKKSAGDIAAHFDLTQAAVSYHLSQLKKADLLVEEKVKNYIYYELNISVFEEVMLWLAQFRDEKEVCNDEAREEMDVADYTHLSAADDCGVSGL